METRNLGKIGFDVSLLGYGCMRFPTGADGKIDRVKAKALLNHAIANGVNYIDTAYPYHNGESEPFVGEALQDYPRDSYYLATKLPVWAVNTLEDVDRIFAEQLGHLQTDYVDFYLMHAMNKGSWDKMVEIGCVKRLEELKAEGKIRNLGFSFHDGYPVFEGILNYRDWDFCQIQLNYMDTEEQAGLKGYELAASKNIPLVIMEPVKGGTLAAFADDIMEKFHKQDPEASAASFALRYVASLPNVLCVLSGMTTMDQLTDNLHTFIDFKPLSDKERDVIDEVVKLLRSRVQNGCTGCRYCTPCPAGVDIPGNFRAWNTYHMYQNYNVVRWTWEHEITPEHQACKCIECGKCEKACPQHLSIREDLKKVFRDMEKKEMML